MKTCVLFACVVAFLWVKVNADCPPLNNPNGARTVKDGAVVEKDCAQFICQYGRWMDVGCPIYHCKGEIGQTNYDYSKPYPDCCPRPICPYYH